MNTGSRPVRDQASHLEYFPVDQDRWSDLEKLFESRGGPHSCWCMVWRNMITGKRRENKQDKKASLKNFVDRRIPVGILGYSGGDPVAWCSVAPRESLRDPGGDESLNEVWSIVCFFIRRPFRKRGISGQLIREAARYAKNMGAEWIEAYPVDPDSPSYRFMGFTGSFEKEGFEFVKKAGTRRKVMRLDLISWIPKQ
jgi:GNAT superfamily N-acetyltransferase